MFTNISHVLIFSTATQSIKKPFLATTKCEIHNQYGKQHQRQQNGNKDNFYWTNGK